MYAYIDGKIVYKDPAYTILEVNGIGYELKISLNTYSQIKSFDRCKLFTYLHIKEDAHTLYGFSNLQEKQTFLSLISISGVGPGTALMVLSSLTAIELQQAIINNHVKVIQSVKGIGAKTAQRIILELRDKINHSDTAETPDILSPTSHTTLKDEALSALTTLGISKSVADKTINTILRENHGEITLEELIKKALKAS